MKLEEINLENIKILDKYVLRHIIEIFILGVVIFSSIVFASQAFIDLMRKISEYGIQPKIALMMIILNLPAVFVMAIPMSMLLATVMGLNKLCLSSEITIMKACGIGLNRIARSIFAFSIAMALVSFMINEFVVPVMGSQSKTLGVWAIGQKNIPDGKKNYTLKEMHDNDIKRFFYVQNCTKKNLENVSVIDFSDEEKTQIVQASKGETAKEGWVFKNASVYTIDDEGKLMNTSWVAKTTVDFGIDAKDELEKANPEEFNFSQLARYIKNTKFEDEKEKNGYKVALHEKIALPFTTIALTILGIPLAITPPRAKYNRGFLLCILIILIYYVMNAFAEVMGEAGTIPPILAAWLPNIILSIIGFFAYRRKAYTIC